MIARLIHLMFIKLIKNKELYSVLVHISAFIMQAYSVKPEVNHGKSNYFSRYTFPN